MVPVIKNTFADEIRSGQRFKFGTNWQRFLQTLNEKRIAAAQESLLNMLHVDSLASKRFLDAGHGSGLFSLAARCLGATVHSFDYDPQCVACAQELRRRYFPEDPNWTIEQGSALDQSYLSALGTFDVVYSWGVLHHTGDMWAALGLIVQTVKERGYLYIAIYEDSGIRSRIWRRLKKLYNRLPSVLRIPYALFVSIPRAVQLAARAVLLRLGNDATISKSSSRGMNRWYDMIDWVGGYPYEFARPEQILDFYLARDFTLKALKTVGGDLACNEFVFQRGG